MSSTRIGTVRTTITIVAVKMMMMVIIIEIVAVVLFEASEMAFLCSLCVDEITEMRENVYANRVRCTSRQSEILAESFDVCSNNAYE